MWTRSYSIVAKDVTGEQMWRLFADVNNWHTWDDGIESTCMNGAFEKGNHFILKPKGGPKVKVDLLETTENKSFLDVTRFPLAKMYDNHTFEETPEGLKITNTISVTGILSFLWIKLVAQNIVNALPADIPKQVAAAKKY
ncbi:MAG: SRPBCC family protein [Filimonas sp.]|nr:SRPBCC family protein [Filimonas sp.]